MGISPLFCTNLQPTTLGSGGIRAYIKKVQARIIVDSGPREEGYPPMVSKATSDTDQDLQQRKALITAMMAHVPFDGWKMETVQMAADECALSDADLDRLLPDGVASAVRAYVDLADAEMVAAFEALTPPPEKTHLKIRALILTRLQQAQPHKETVRKTMAYLANPQHAALATELLYRTVDTMWRAAGDSTTDFSFYSKRATLSAVYSATLLAFLADESADLADTEAFLDRRLKDVAQIPKVTAPVADAARHMSKFATQFMARMGSRSAR